MSFLSNRDVFEMHNHPHVAEALAEAQVTCRKNNNEMEKRHIIKTEG